MLKVFLYNLIADKVFDIEVCRMEIVKNMVVNKFVFVNHLLGIIKKMSFGINDGHYALFCPFANIIKVRNRSVHASTSCKNRHVVEAFHLEFLNYSVVYFESRIESYH